MCSSHTAGSILGNERAPDLHPSSASASASSAAWNPVVGSILAPTVGFGGPAQVGGGGCRFAHHVVRSGLGLARVDVGSALAPVVVCSRTGAPSSSPSLEQHLQREDSSACTVAGSRACYRLLQAWVFIVLKEGGVRKLGLFRKETGAT